MKKIKLFLTAFYIFIIAYFAIFNWDIFVLKLDVNLGFQSVNFPLVAGIFFIGIIFFILLLLNTSITNIVNKNKLAKSNEQLSKFNYTNSSEIENKLEKIQSSIDELKSKFNHEFKRTTLI
jgi:predicted PurR-regulated permease PerM